MKHWIAALGIALSSPVNAALINYADAGGIWGYDADWNEKYLGDYIYSINYDTETQLFSNGFFHSLLGSGQAEFVKSVGEYDNVYLMAYDIMYSGFTVHTPKGEMYIGSYEWFAYVPEGGDPFAHLDNSFGYMEIVNHNTAYDRVLFWTLPSAIRVPSTAEESAIVSEPATIALFGFGLAGLGYTKRRRS